MAIDRIRISHFQFLKCFVTGGRPLFPAQQPLRVWLRVPSRRVSVFAMWTTRLAPIEHMGNRFDGVKKHELNNKTNRGGLIAGNHTVQLRRNQQLPLFLCVHSALPYLNIEHEKWAKPEAEALRAEKLHFSWAIRHRERESIVDKSNANNPFVSMKMKSNLFICIVDATIRPFAQVPLAFHSHSTRILWIPLGIITTLFARSDAFVSRAASTRCENGISISMVRRSHDDKIQVYHRREVHTHFSRRSIWTAGSIHRHGDLLHIFDPVVGSRFDCYSTISSALRAFVSACDDCLSEMHSRLWII